MSAMKTTKYQSSLWNECTRSCGYISFPLKYRRRIMVEWPKEDALVLIQNWEQHDCLYDPKSEYYHNKHARNDALERLAREVECYVPNITANELKTKFNYLRTQYCRELGKIKDSYKSGSGYDEIYTPTAYWLNDLNFLKSHVTDVDVYEDYDQLVTPSSAKKKRKHQTSPGIAPEDEILVQAQQLLQKFAQPCATSTKFDEGLLYFLQENLCEITNKALKDELSEEIISLVMQCKRQQRTLDD